LDKAIEQLAREREQRVKDAVDLKEPDRVPVLIPMSYYPAKFAGITIADAYYNPKKWRKAYIAAVQYLQPDRTSLTANQAGSVYEILGSKQMQWPGHGVGVNSSHQFVEGEYMKADEYDDYLNNNADWVIRCYLPRVWKALEPFGELPSFETSLFSLPFRNLATPEFAQSFEALTKAARIAIEWQNETAILAQELEEIGYSQKGEGMGAGSPFDMISDFLRGMRGAMLDMYRRPDKLLELIELQSNRQLERIKVMPPADHFTLCFTALHRGADGFMSMKQFDTFYWPYLLKNIKAIVEKGYTPNIFFEGDYTSRLERLLEMPKGKVVASMDRSDMKRTKEVLGGHVCILGAVPPSLLQTGSVEDVKKHCKWLIDVVGKGGGYIMAPAAATDQAKTENLKAVVDFTKEYGRYR
jgi:uroporphyrinogen-III decarboxylase